jgi:hypothetical protein
MNDKAEFQRLKAGMLAIWKETADSLASVIADGLPSSVEPALSLSKYRMWLYFAVDTLKECSDPMKRRRS